MNLTHNYIAPTILTDRLSLRATRLDDFEASFAMWSDPEFVRFIGGKPSDRAESHSRLLRYGGLWPLLGYGYWAVEDRASGRYAGEVGFADFKRELTEELEDVPEAGWVIAPEFAGQGYATEAMMAAAHWMDQQDRWRSTFCMVVPENHRSIRVAKKLGYTPRETVDHKGSEVTLFDRTSSV